MGDERILLLDDRVHSGADQERWRQVEDLVEDGIQYGQEHVTVVRTGIAPQTDKGVGFFGCRHRGDFTCFIHEGYASFRCPSGKKHEVLAV